MANGASFEYDEKLRRQVEYDFGLLTPIIARFAEEKGVEIRTKKYSPGIEWGHNPRRFVYVGVGRSRKGERWFVTALAKMQKPEGNFQKGEWLREYLSYDDLAKLEEEFDELLYRGWRLANTWCEDDLKPGHGL